MGTELQCVDCKRFYSSKEGLGEDGYALAIADLVCPRCGDCLVAAPRTKVTCVELMASLLAKLPEEQWDSVVWTIVKEHNAEAYKLPTNVLNEVFSTLKMIFKKVK